MAATSSSSSSVEQRDVLLLGATGYTGKLILKHLSEGFRAERFTLSLGGRSKARMSNVLKEVGLDNVPAIEFDVMDDAQVRDVIKDFRVVITAVGPFWQYGRVLVKACAELGVHYVDTTGKSSLMGRGGRKISLLHPCQVKPTSSEIA